MPKGIKKRGKSKAINKGAEGERMKIELRLFACLSEEHITDGGVE